VGFLEIFVENFLSSTGGTNVKSTKEVGRIKIVKRENGGKNNKRITIIVERLGTI